MFRLQGEEEDGHVVRELRLSRTVAVHADRRQPGQALHVRAPVAAEPHVLHGGLAAVRRRRRDQPQTPAPRAPVQQPAAIGHTGRTARHARAPVPLQPVPGRDARPRATVRLLLVQQRHRQHGHRQLDRVVRHEVSTKSPNEG